MNWQVPRIWEGGDVWILGGGPSVVEQFDIPENIVQDVMNKVSPPSIYSPYMKAIHSKHVIAINVAFLIGEWMDMVFFGDNKFFLPNMQQLFDWPGLKVSCHGGVEKIPWVKYLPRDGNKPRGISNNPKTVSWNANSGCSAISVAANAGARRIILLGFDMTINEKGNQHWHTFYKGLPDATLAQQRRDKDPRLYLPFNRHLIGFPDIARDAKARGIEILNASPNSVINQFPKYTVKEILAM